MILIVGASGWLGGAVARQLLAAGKAVRLMTRNPAKLDDLARLGAHVVVGDLRQPGSLRQAFLGVDQVLAAAHAYPGQGSNNPHLVDDVGNRYLVDLARVTGVTHFVFVSALGARPDHTVDLLRIKYGVEQYVRHNVLSYTILRPAAFMESWAASIGEQIARKSELTIVGRGENPINFVSVEDAARFAVIALERPEARGKILDVGGPENLTLQQVIGMVEQAWGRDARKKYVSARKVEALSTLVRLFNRSLGRRMEHGVYLDTANLAFDPTETLKLFPLRLSRFEEVVQKSYAPLPQNEIRQVA